METEVFLLGNADKIRLIELVNYIKQIYCSSSEIVCVEECGNRYFTLNVEKAVNYGYQSKKIEKIINELCMCERGMTNADVT